MHTVEPWEKTPSLMVWLGWKPWRRYHVWGGVGGTFGEWEYSEGGPSDV